MHPCLSSKARWSSTRPTFLALLVGAVLLFFSAAPVSASLILTEPDDTSGTGLGAVFTVLTLNEEPPEDQVHSGCVQWDGAMDQSGAMVCPAPFDGGDEQTQTQTRTLAEVGLTDAFNLRVVFNYNEPQSGMMVDDITIEDMVLTLYAPDGSVCFDSGPFTPETFPDTFSGVGNSGFVFRLDTQQAAQAQPCFADPQTRIGLAGLVSGAGQGPETFYIARAMDLLPGSADLAVTKTDSTDPVATGATFTYTLEVTNAGPNTATGVQLVDTLPADVTFSSATITSGSGTCSQSGRTVTCDLGDLPAGESATVEIEVVAGSTGSLTNNALVSGDQPDPVPSNNTATETTQVTGGTPGAEVDLSLIKTDSPDPVAVGADLTYTLTVRNLGPDGPAVGVTVTDQLPASVTFGSATPKDETGDGTDSCSLSGRTVTCDLGSLPAGSLETVTIVVTPTATGQIDNLAQVSSDSDEVNPGNNQDDESTTVVSTTPADQVDLVLTKTDSMDPVGSGDDFTYTLSVENRGTTDATGVTLTDNLPADASFVSASPGCTYTGGGTGGTVVCDLGTLAAGASTSVMITVNVAPTGVVTNNGVVTADQDDINPGDNTASETTSVEDGPPPTTSADLMITKSDSQDPVAVGQQLTYTLVISNGGPDTATDLVVTDNLPERVSFVGGPMACSHDGSAFGGTVTCTLGDLAVGASTSVDLTVQAEEEGFADNFAAAASDTPDPDTGNNTATERTTIGTPPGAATASDLVLLKTASPDPVAVGGTLTYNLTVTNDGPDAATGIQVVDNLPATVACLSATTPDGTCACPMEVTGGTVVCTLDPLAVGAMALISIDVQPTEAGTVLNAAVVSGNEADPNPGNNSDDDETTVSDAGVPPIPTASETMLLLLALLMAAGGLWTLRR